MRTPPTVTTACGDCGKPFEYVKSGGTARLYCGNCGHNRIVAGLRLREMLHGEAHT